MGLQADRLDEVPREDMLFFRTRNEDEDETKIKERILEVARRAYEVFPYKCIEMFVFPRSKTAFFDSGARYGFKSPYKRALEVCSAGKGDLYLDVGCFFGVDLRKAVADGIPIENVIGIDLHKAKLLSSKDFWKWGHELFNTSPETFPAAFIVGDVLDEKIISGRGISPSPSSSSTSPRPVDLRILTSLTPLHGRISVIQVSNIFHFYPEDKQLELARALVSLLLPQRGSMIFGMQRAAAEGEEPGFLRNPNGNVVFTRSVQGLKGFWEGVFRDAGVELQVDAWKVGKEETEIGSYGVDMVVWGCNVR
ncbi:hypothetical protein V5O48_008004 [Marasmius crinis-equi]|uniref:Methyltransferase domain-containing protein n=1 Tax=Marasmius crinis-equi TaxID=585013 RepID=A0ABR3FFL6_9AGAR